MPSYKQAMRHRINRVLEKTGFHIARFKPETKHRYTESPWLRQWQVRAFREELNAVLRFFPEVAARIPSSEHIDDFLQRIKSCPVQQTAGGGGVTTAAILWCIARSIDPTRIIESGVFRGFTTWVLEDACPQAERYSCDISFDEVRWSSSTAVYHAKDWSQVDALKQSVAGKSLAFFDDHVSQLRRVREATERGIRYLVFDDCFPVEALHSDGEAAFPTIPMIFDARLRDGLAVEWATESGKFKYVHSERVCKDVRRHIKQWTPLPSGESCLGFTPSHLVLVELSVDECPSLL
jgi:hypothetical protein